MPHAVMAVAAWVGMTAFQLASTAGASVAVASTVANIAVAATAVTAVVGVAELSQALQPKVGGTYGSQVDYKADPNAGLPYAIGRTGVAGNLAFRQSAGAKNSYLNDVAVYSLGPIDSYESFSVNGTAVTFGADSGEGASGYYLNRMWRVSQLGAQPESGYLHWTATGTKDTPANHSGLPSEWTSAHKLSGLAADLWALQYNTDKYTAGVPQRVTVGKWVLAYDPRLDSTYPGGSGAHRDDDETTWAWTENPYLHALTWLIGRYQAGERVIGVGAPIDMIDVAAFVEGANVADANGWTCGGLVYSTDDKYEVLKAFLQAGGGKPMRLGAKISCLVNTPRTSLATITAADVVGEASIAGTTSRSGRINTVWPRYHEEAQGWQMVTADEPVSVSTYVTEDGEKVRSRTLEYPLVQDVDQVAQLAYYDIADSREFTPVVLPCKPIWMGYPPGSVITADEPEWGLNGQTLLILRTNLDPLTMQVTLTCRSETDAKHAAALGQSGVAPSTPALTGMDPNVVVAPGSGIYTAAGATLSGAGGLTAAAIVVSATADAPDNYYAVAVLVRYRVHGTSDWSYWPAAPIAATRIEITSVVPGAAYDVEVAYRGVRGGESAYTACTGGPFTSGSLTSANRITRSTSAPSSPLTSDVWVKLDGSGNQIEIYIWAGSSWIKASDVTSFFTAAAITGQGALATLNVVDGVRLAAAQGTNAIVDAGFRFQSTYWTNITSGSGSWATSVGTSGNLRWLQRLASGTPGAAVQTSMGQGFHAGLLPCKPTDRIEASVYLAGSGVATAELVVEWFNASGTYLSGTSLQTLTGNPANTGFSAGITGQTRLAGFATAPTSAAYAELCVVWTTTAGAAPFLQMALPLIRQANSGQTESTPWSPGVEAELGADTTSTHTAAAITGQGALATLNQATWATQVTGTGKPDDFANKSLVYRQTSAPSSPGVNDIWVKINGGGTQEGVYAWSGSTWLLGSDVTGLFTAAAIAGQGALATLNVVDNVRLAAAIGANAIVDAGFRFLSSYWTNVTASGGSWTSNVGTAGNIRYFQRLASGTPGAGVQTSQGQGFHAGLLPCVSGDRVEASVYVAGSGVASYTLLVEWFNASGSFLGNSSVQSVSANPATSNFNSGIIGASRLSGFATAPSSTAYAELLVVWTTTSAATPNLQMGLPLIRRAASGQTDITPWTPGVEAQLGADVTSTNTAAAIAGQGGFATGNYYEQSSDPGSVPNGSIWVDTSGTYKVVKLRISGSWSTIANNASPSTSGFNVTLDDYDVVTVGHGVPISSATITATAHNAAASVTWTWVQIATDPSGHTITISHPGGDQYAQFAATVNVGNEPYGSFMVIATDGTSTAQAVVRVQYIYA